MNEEPDYLDHLISDAVGTRPGFADLWAPYGLMLDLAAERVRLGLSQQDVAERMGIGRPSVARMENHPEGVSMARIARYAHAVGATLKVVPGDAEPKPASGGPGRPVGARTKRSAA